MPDAVTGLRTPDLLGGVDPAEFERALIGEALAGAGRSELVVRLHRATGRHCRLVTADGSALTTTDGGSGVAVSSVRRVLDAGCACIGALDGWRGVGVAARVGTTEIGVLVIAEPATETDRALARAAITGLLIDAVRHSTPVATGGRDSAHETVAALRAGAVGPATLSASEAIGLDFGRPACGAVLHYGGTRQRAWATAIAWLDHPIENDGRSAWTVVAGPAALDRLRRSLTTLVDPASIVVACGSAVTQPERLHESFSEAERLLRIAIARGARSLSFDAAGVSQILLAAPQGRLEWFVQRHLGAILDRPELMCTLRAWLAEGGSRRAVSEQLHLHRNTVGYRVGQLKKMLGLDPLAPGNAAVLHTALAAADLLATEPDGTGTVKPPGTCPPERRHAIGSRRRDDPWRTTESSPARRA